MKKLKLLISNDDGIQAEGIARLARAAAQFGDVWVAAPQSQCSGMSQKLTIFGEIAVERAVFPAPVQEAWAIGGTPADCVKLGLACLCPEAEAVISGVNHGYNAGSDVLYSGTVGAAMEGALSGLPALAISLGSTREDTYDKAAATAVTAFGAMLAHPLPPCSVLNVNYPTCDEAKGLVAAPMQQLHYDETYTKGVNAAGEITYTLTGCIAPGRRQSRDYELLEQGYATMTVLHYDMTHAEATDGLTGLI